MPGSAALSSFPALSPLLFLLASPHNVMCSHRCRGRAHGKGTLHRLPAGLDREAGRSGLGLEAQRRRCSDYLDGGKWTLVAEVVEIESGKRDDRPKLAEALALCRLTGATLVIAKLDRLARNVAFISNLMESGVDFVAVDFPQANRLTVHILAAVAEHEAEMISERTKAALAAAKARGVQLGGDRGNRTRPGPGRTRAIIARKAKRSSAPLI